MRYLSVCSGIEAASAAWHDLGWTPVAFAEVEPFPSAVLAQRFPGVPNWGDMTKFKEWPDADVDVLVGGTPCQSFSVAGLRKGLDDPRGSLMLTFLGIAARYRPRYVVWENVPGVLSSNGGRDFGSFLGALGQLGYGWAYRVLDAQWFGVAQRRRRVFVVGCAGDQRRAAQVLFEREGVCRDSAPRREAGQRPAPSPAARTRGGGGLGTDAELDGALIAEIAAFGGNNTAGPIDVATACNAHGGPHGRLDFESETFVAHSLRAEGFDASEDGTGRGTPLVPVGVDGFNGSLTGHVAATMGTRGSSETASGPQVMVPVAFAQNSRDEVRLQNGDGQIVGALAAEPGMKQTSYVAFQPRIARNGRGDMGDLVNALQAQSGGTGKGDAAPCVAIADTLGVGANQTTGFQSEVVAVALAPTITASNDPSRSPQSSEVTQQVEAVHRASMQVRRLTPRECERLQGFPDNWTAIPWRGRPADECPDGPRYKALGNSMAVPCMRYLGERIAATEALRKSQ